MNKDKNIPTTEDIDKTIVIPGNIPPPAAAGVLKSAGMDRTLIRKRTFWGRLGNLFTKRTVVEDTIFVLDDISGSHEPDKYSENDCSWRDVYGSFKIAEQPFASGGQGSLSKAVDRVLGCEVALKSLHKELCGNASARENFVKEARLTAALDHPAIIPIHGLFSDDGNGMHLAMKFIDGCTLAEYIRKVVNIYSKKGIDNFNEKKSLRHRLEIFLRVCDAMEYAHARGIIHRDLKLENIMLGRHRAAYVTDWGIASNIKERGKQQHLTGTPGFIAPEVLDKKVPDERSDVYSLGIILFELVTLNPAFSGDDLTGVLQRVKAGMHAPLKHRFKFPLAPDLIAVIRKAINTDPEKRYQSVREFAEDLRRYRANEEVSARPDNFFTRIARWGINHRRGMMLTVMALLLCAIGGMAYTFYHEYRISLSLHIRDNSISMVHSNVTRITNEMGNAMKKYEYYLEQMRMNMLFSALKPGISGQAHKDIFLILPESGASLPEYFVKSEFYRQFIAPDKVVIFNFRTGKVSAEHLHNFANTALFMRQIVLDVQPGESETAAAERLLKSGQPVRMSYFALSDGTFAAYPAICDFPENYRPEQRKWYTAARKAAGRKVWSQPYRDVGGYSDLVSTCSAAVMDANNRFTGVAALDFSLTRLAERMLHKESQFNSVTHEKMFISAQGKILFRTVVPEYAAAPRFNDNAQIRKMLAMKYGALLMKKDGKNMLLVFSCVENVDMIYAEYIDLDALTAMYTALNN